MLTTPLYYVNGAPHIGHAYTTIAADSWARFKRQQGHEVFFLTGTDEHGQKIHEAATKAGKTPKEYTDEMAAPFALAWKVLGCQEDVFVRTTLETHFKGAQAAFSKLMASGDLYRGKYAGWYCVADERFFPENQLEEVIGPDGQKRFVTPDLHRPVEWLEEESWFFKLSAYAPKILSWLKDHPDFIQPAYRAQELISRLEGPIEDLSVSRKSVSWGIPTPDDSGETIYVWFEALLCYLTGAGYGSDEEKFNSLWPAEAQFLGKDILWFHGVIWPALLMALELDLPKSLRTHGWWMVEGEKMSKSLGNVIDPVEIAQQVGADAFRYFLLKEASFGQDGNFSRRALMERKNSDLADDLGNLLHRFVNMAQKYEGRRIPFVVLDGPLEKEVLAVFAQKLPEAREFFENTQFHFALQAVFECVRRLNKYIEETKPWTLRTQGRGEDVRGFLGFTAQQMIRLGAALWCVMPSTCSELFKRLGFSHQAGTIPSWDLTQAGVNWASALLVEEPGAPLFPKEDPVSDTPAPAVDETPSPAPAPAPASAPEPDDFIDITDFAKVKLRVAEVISADFHPKADKLLRLQVDLGDEKRQILAGIRHKYSPEELVGKRIVIVANLKPRTMRGEISQGMVLAADDGELLGVLTPDRPVKPGSEIR